MNRSTKINKGLAFASGVGVAVCLFLAVYVSPLPQWVKFLVWAGILFFMMATFGSMAAAKQNKYEDVDVDDLLVEEEGEGYEVRMRDGVR